MSWLILLFLQIFWAGPMGGAIVAAILYKLVFNPYRGELSVEEASRKLCKYLEVYFNVFILERDDLRETSIGRHILKNQLFSQGFHFHESLRIFLRCILCFKRITVLSTYPDNFIRGDPSLTTFCQLIREGKTKMGHHLSTSR